MEEGSHPVPFRTRKLSPPSPKVLPCSRWEDRTPLAHRGLSPHPGPRAGPFFVPRKRRVRHVFSAIHACFCQAISLETHFVVHIKIFSVIILLLLTSASYPRERKAGGIYE